MLACRSRTYTSNNYQVSLVFRLNQTRFLVVRFEYCLVAAGIRPLAVLEPALLLITTRTKAVQLATPGKLETTERVSKSLHR